jgi:hypothetical protein
MSSDKTKIAIGDRVRFDGKRTSWLARAASEDGRYLLLTAALFGQVAYTIIDWEKAIRGPMNVIGWGLGIDTLSGPDEAIDGAMLMLRPLEPFPPGVSSRPVTEPRGFEVSRRGQVPLTVTGVRPGGVQ